MSWYSIKSTITHLQRSWIY